MPDNFIHIQFIIRKKNETKLMLNKVLEYNKESYLLLGYNFDVLNNIYNSINQIVMNYLKKYLIYNNTCVTLVIHYNKAGRSEQSFMVKEIFFVGTSINQLKNQPIKTYTWGSSGYQ